MKPKIITITIVILALIHLFIGMWWVSALLLIILAGYYLTTSKNKYITAFRKKSFLVYPLSLTGIFLLSIVLRVFIFGFFIVPTNSMERTILPGDVIWVNKTLIGPKVPSSIMEIPWISVIYWVIKTDKSNLSEKWCNYFRLKGYTSITQQDILVFEHPYVDLVLVKRCMGCPGDTLQIINSKVSVNHQYLKEKTNTQITANKPLDKEHNFNPEELFPHHSASAWTTDNFGPFILPYKGMTIALNKENYLLYHEIIENLENCRIVINDMEHYTVDGSERKEYTFKNNYYFFMGDNRDFSHDSRFFGPVPESLIIGKATTILFSKNKQTAWHQRILKKLY